MRIHRTAYLVGKRRVLNCSDCAIEAALEGMHVVKIKSRKDLDALFIKRKISDNDPAFCSNCCELISMRPIKGALKQILHKVRKNNVAAVAENR